jgi:hypothetical protein
MLSSVEYKNIDCKKGKVDIEGECIRCKHKGIWNDINLFSINSVGCKKCGQKHNVVLPNELRENIDDNITRLLTQYKNIAMWGMNTHAYDLIKKSNVINNANIHLIDISQVAQKVLIYDKKVNSPEIIEDKDVKAIIVCLPHHFIQIEQQIKKYYKNVVKVVNITELISKDFQV